MSKTLENLKVAFAGESMARNKYTFFAKVAKKERLNFVAHIFEETATHEQRHAKSHFVASAGLGTTAENLRSAIDGEHYEWTEMYPDFARIAREEGRPEIAALFDQIAQAEAFHEERFKTLLTMLEDGTLYKRDAPILWKCNVCGWTYEGKEPPEKCPCCDHHKGHFFPEDVF